MYAWLLLVCLVGALPLRAGAPAFQLVSATDPTVGPPSSGGGDSWTPIISADGRYVLFASAANNLAFAGTNTVAPLLFPPRLNVFLRDRSNATTILVSVNLSGTGGGNGDSFPADLSSNGRYVLFESSASNLVLGNTNGTSNIFIRDVVSGTTTLVSAGTNGAAANGECRGSSMTPDGRFVAFVSAASNLVANDTNSIADVFVRDLQTGTTLLASPGAMDASRLSLSRSEAPVLTPDGQYVAFLSSATNLVMGVRAPNQIYVRDLVLGTTTWASSSASNALYSVQQTTNLACYNHAISADGQYVAFEVSPGPGSKAWASGIVLRYNIGSGFTDVIQTNATVQMAAYENIHSLEMTPDGRFIAFIANTNGVLGANTCVELWDGQSGSLSLVSGDQNGLVPTNSLCSWPTIDPSGRYVAFICNSNLINNPSVGDFHVFVRDVSSNTTTLVDVDTNGAGVGVLPSCMPRLSADSKYAAFAAADSSLVANDRNRDFDVFIRDLAGGTTSLLSAANPALPSSTPNGTSALSSWGLSFDGRYVALSSEAENLVANDTNGFRDVFVRDLSAGTTRLVSISTNGFSGDNLSAEPAISADGRYVAFSSAADNLVANDSNRLLDVFVRDLQNSNTTLASISTSGTAANGASWSPVISAAGRYLLFRSRASNLAPGSGTLGVENLYLRDMQAATTVALTSGGVIASSMTPDGRFVAFAGIIAGTSVSRMYVWDSLAAGLVFTNLATNIASVSISPDGNRIAYSLTNELVVADRQSLTNWLIGPSPANSRAVQRFSADGRLLAYATLAAQSLSDTNGTNDVYLFDLETQTRTLVSQSYLSGASGNAVSDSPDISADGRFIAYRSAASDIAPGHTSGNYDVFLYDRFSGSNTLLTAGQTGGGGMNASLGPVFSGDGRTLAFPTWAPDLTGQDFNQSADVLAYSFFYATLTVQTAAGTTISWPANTGTMYQVQFKKRPGDTNWQTLAGSITIQGNKATFVDASPLAGQRFYRVVSH